MTNPLSTEQIAVQIIDAVIDDIEGGWPQDTERCPAYRHIEVYDAASRVNHHLSAETVEAVYWSYPTVKHTDEYNAIMAGTWPGSMNELIATIMVAMHQRMEARKLVK